MPPAPELPPVPDLLVRLATGDHSAFTELVRYYTARLLGYAIRLAGDEGVAEDVVQDVWCWVWERRSVVGAIVALHDVHALEGYLRRAVYHRVIDKRRTERARDARGARFSAMSGGEYPETVTHELESTELTKAISAAIAALPERRREIVLRRWSLQTTREIARALGISPKTVEAQITAAYATLRDTLRRFIVDS